MTDDDVVDQAIAEAKAIVAGIQITQKDILDEIKRRVRELNNQNQALKTAGAELALILACIVSGGGMDDERRFRAVCAIGDWDRLIRELSSSEPNHG